jgi:hypothetical protein
LALWWRSHKQRNVIAALWKLSGSSRLSIWFRRSISDDTISIVLNGIVCLSVALFVILESKASWYRFEPVSLQVVYETLPTVILDCVLFAFVAAWPSRMPIESHTARRLLWLRRSCAIVGGGVILSSFLLSHYASYRANINDPYLPAPQLVGTVIVLIFGGLATWWQGRGEDESYSTLGAAILGGALVGVTVFGIQINTDTQRQRIADRDSIQSVVAFRQNLSHLDFSGKDLSFFSFDKKNMSNINLIDANLSSASFFKTNLRGAFLGGADLSNAGLSHADLRASELGGVQTSNTYVGRADLRKAFICSADLSGVQDLESANLHGAVASSSARWPSGFDYHGAGVTVSDEACD